MMIQNMISQYVRTLFEENPNGLLTVGAGTDRFEHKVSWDRQTAEALALQCDALVCHLTELAVRTDLRNMTKEQKDIWNTYLRPFPEHGMDKDVLREIWEKEAIGLLLSARERQFSRQYNDWYQEQALQRLPWKGCAPTDLIRCARRYVRLVQLNAPAALQEHEARWLAEEFVLYHCMQ